MQSRTHVLLPYTMDWEETAEGKEHFHNNVPITDKLTILRGILTTVHNLVSKTYQLA